MKKLAVIWMFSIFLLSCGEAKEEFLRIQGQWFVDEYGRKVILRGINFSDRSKRPPFTPEVPYEDIDRLKEWGFNSVRFLVIWEGLEPEKGVFSPDYLGRIMKWIHEFSKREIYVILDMHQDLYARKLGGDGAPEWAVLEIEHQPVTPWYLNYLSRAVIENFDRFWRDEELQEHYIKAWEFLAEAVKEEKYVIGYDLMNEPFFGSASPLTPEFEVHYLQPFYERLISHLRKIDSNHIFFFEPGIIAGGGLPCFLKKMPFPNLAYAPHYYDPAVLWEFPYDGKEERTKSAFILRERESERWEVPWVLGEFGILLHTFGAEEYLEDHMRLIESFMIGSFYWNYNREEWDDMSPVNPDGKEKCLWWCPLDILSRPYPQKTNGEPLWFSFDRKEREFSFILRASGGSMPTEIFIPSRHFGKGFDVEIEGGEGGYFFEKDILSLLAKEKKIYKIRIKARGK